MTAYYVATLARYVVVGVYADLRERWGREVPIEIRTVRPATPDEIDMTRWHNEMVAREARNEAAR